MEETNEKSPTRPQAETYVSPLIYALGRATGLLLWLGTALTAAYMAALKFGGPSHRDTLMMPYKWYLSGKNSLLGAIKDTSIFKKALKDWKPKGMPQHIDGGTQFVIASTVAFTLSKLIAIPWFAKYEREAQEINTRIAAKDRTIAEQNTAIEGMQAELGELRGQAEKKNETSFQDKHKMKRAETGSYREQYLSEASNSNTSQAL